MTRRLAALALLLSSPAFAQTPAASTAKPADATGQCRDGTYSTAANKSGACRGHNGVKDWYAASASKPALSATETNSVPAAAQVQTSAPAAAPAQQAGKPSAASSVAKKGPKANLANMTQAPGGGPGLVWVNTSSNVYHCPGTDYYGKTKAGSYMSEAEAQSKGAHPDHGNACTK